MANNRVWLIHQPSKLGIMLGKRLLGGYYQPPAKEEIQRFYDYIEKNFPNENEMDDLVLAMERCPNDLGLKEWGYTDEKKEGFRMFDLNLGQN